jgi:predicted phosphoribosyltransferase
MRRFHDRFDAGRLLAEKLRRYADRNDVLILRMPSRR